MDLLQNLSAAEKIFMACFINFLEENIRDVVHSLCLELQEQPH